MKRTLKILCLEDDQEDFEIINHTLEKGGLSIAALRVDTKEKYLDALSTYHPDVILSDHSLPQFNSTEALKLCQARHLQIPFILVTGAVSDEFAVNCMKLGADDYVLKSNLNRLPSAIENALKHKRSEIARLKATLDLAGRNDELLKINNELDSFVYSVSHNLRAPLMSVLGLLNLVKRESDTHNLDQYHKMMEESINKLDNTVKEILDYSRNARQELQIGPIDFKNLIKETLDKMQFMPGFELLDIQVLVDDQVAFHSDFYRVSVILNNLISNAIKYLDQTKQKPFLAVTVAIDEKKAKLVFQDNGIGIDNVLLPKVFDMFYRATNKNEGSGLGLYIVKEASEKLLGKIEIESKVGTGTLITVEIPNHVHHPKAKKHALTADGS
jgi:signal transduction histidine kinase